MLTRVCSMILLKAELKSRKRSLRSVSRWVRAEWITGETASDVDWFFL